MFGEDWTRTVEEAGSWIPAVTEQQPSRNT